MRGGIGEADECEAGHHDAAKHQPARSEPIDHPAGDEPKRDGHRNLAVGIARGHLLPAPAELLDEERIEARQAVERHADDGKQREERRDDREDLLAASGGRVGHDRAGLFASRSTAPSG